MRRLDLALALVGDPQVLFLDEPTTGFDPGARRRAWSLVEGLKGLGKTVFLTTHYLDEAQKLADRVAVLDRGAIVAEGPPESLTVEDSTTIRFRLHPGADRTSMPLGGSGYGREVVFETKDPVRDLQALTAWALDRGIDLEALEVRRPSLEEAYLRLVGEQE